MKQIILAITGVYLLSGCATELLTYDNSNNQTKGIPVPKTKLVKVTTTTNYKAITGAKNPELCNETSVKEAYDYITSGEYYYVNFDPSEFAKGTFEITFNEKGLASKISVNSEANTGLDSVKGLLDTTLPFFRATKAEKLAAESAKSVEAASARITAVKNELSAADKKALSCIVKSESIKLGPLSIK